MEENEYIFSIYAKDSYLLIKNNKSLNIKGFVLQINTSDYTLSVVEYKENLGKKINDCMGIIGVIMLENSTYLIIITKASLVCKITKKEIYKVLDTHFINLNNCIEEENEEKSEPSLDEILFQRDKETINLLKEKFKNGFYFSNGYDLANSLTSQNQIQNYHT